MTGEKLLVVGGGGREHVLAWALSRSPDVAEVLVAPGNPGTTGANMRSMSANVEDIPALVKLARDESVDLVVVGPEAPLAAGLVDALTESGIPAFGPTQAAARLESSKAFSKSFMRENGIPTAEYAEFTDHESATRYVDDLGRPVVVKADGLAAGKGVIVCENVEQARAAVKSMLVDSGFGVAGNRIIIEEKLTGSEVSVLAFSDGRTIRVMPPARDHKRVFDADEGPNTGGMGAYAPVPDVDADLMALIERTVLQPAIDGMAARGTPYIGVLYAGLMLTSDGPRTLEFNCRFGDPETQALLPLLESDLLTVLYACVNGTLADVDVCWKQGACAAVVAASPGYPGSYPKGLLISGLDELNDPQTMVFHAGTAYDDDGGIVTAGGRVLAVSALGDDLDSALTRAYASIECIRFDGIHYRRDIGRG